MNKDKGGQALPFASKAKGRTWPPRDLPCYWLPQGLIAAFSFLYPSMYFGRFGS